MESVLYFGARDHGALWQVVEEMQRERDCRVISGHARGVDATAEFTAHSMDREVDSYPARWKDAAGKQDKKAGYDRNKIMVNACDRAKGFLWPGCKGSLHTEECLRKSGKPFTMIEPNLRERGAVLFTGVHRSSRQGKPYKGPGAVDVSSRSFSSTWVKFAPSEGLLSSIQGQRSKAYRVEEEEERRAILDAAWKVYVPGYKQEMRSLYKTNPDAFTRPLREVNFAVLSCYCPAHHPAWTMLDKPTDAFDPAHMQCHRRLLAEILTKVGTRHGIRVLDGGEVNVTKIEASKRQ